MRQTLLRVWAAFYPFYATFQMPAFSTPLEELIREQDRQLAQAITKSPIVWGILGTAAFYGLIHGGPLDTPFIRRYFTSHPVEYAETVMFAIGLAALLCGCSDIVGQYVGPAASRRLAAKRPAQAGLGRGAMPDLLGAAPSRPAAAAGDYYIRRLQAAIAICPAARQPPRAWTTS